MLDQALRKRCEERSFTKIISNNHRIYIEKVYLEDFSALTRVYMEDGTDENKCRVTQ